MATASIHPENPTTTVAEAVEAGYDFLHVQCSGCGYIVQLWLRHRPLRRWMTLQWVGERLTCSRCGEPPKAGTVRYGRQGDAYPTYHLGAYRRA